MKESVGSLKRDTEFALPRTCKRPRSSVNYSKNPNWEYTHRNRRSAASPEGLQSFLKAAEQSEEQEEDLDEIALALLEMSSPGQKDATSSRRATPSTGGSRDKLTARQASFPTAAPYSALHLKSNTLKAVPTIIVTSGSSTDTGPTEVKSTSSDVIDAVNSIGQTGSPSSNQESETVTYVLPQRLERPTGIQRAQTCSFVADSSMQHPKQALDLGAANSLPTAVGRAIAPSRMGHIVSTGNPLPQIMQMANKQVRPETVSKAGTAGTGHSALKSSRPEPCTDLHTQAMLQQILHARLAGKSYPGRPIANSRGGKLIVIPDQPPKGVHTDGAHSGQKQGKHLSLLRVPTLVLSTADKPAAGRSVSPALPLSSNLADRAGKSSQAQLTDAKPALGPQAAFQEAALRSGLVKEETLQRGQDVGRETGAAINNSNSSGDESSEEDWLPNWSLNLYNALNPTVITTGHMTVRPPSQPLEGKTGSVAR